MAADGVNELCEAESEILGDEYDAERHRANQARALQQVGPYEGFHAASDSVEPYQTYGGGHVDLERYAERTEHQQLKHGAHYKKPHRSAKHLRHEEDPRAAAVAVASEPLAEVAVDRHQAETIEERHESHSDHHITHDEPHHHLKVGIAFGRHHPRNGDECDARYGSADHSESHHRPGSLAVAGEECVVVAAA